MDYQFICELNEEEKKSLNDTLKRIYDGEIRGMYSDKVRAFCEKMDEGLQEAGEEFRKAASAENAKFWVKQALTAAAKIAVMDPTNPFLKFDSKKGINKQIAAAEKLLEDLERAISDAHSWNANLLRYCPRICKELEKGRGLELLITLLRCFEKQGATYESLINDSIETCGLDERLHWPVRFSEAKPELFENWQEPVRKILEENPVTRKLYEDRAVLFERADRERKRDAAIIAMESRDSEKELNRALELLGQIGEYRDCAELKGEVRQRINERHRKKAIEYSEATDCIQDLKLAIMRFEKLGDYRDCEKLKAETERKLEECYRRKYDEASLCMANAKNEEELEQVASLWFNLEDYRDARAKWVETNKEIANLAKQKSFIKRIIMCGIVAAVIAIVAVIVVTTSKSV